MPRVTTGFTALSGNGINTSQGYGLGMGNFLYLRQYLYAGSMGRLDIRTRISEGMTYGSYPLFQRNLDQFSETWKRRDKPDSEGTVGPFPNSSNLLP